MRFLKFLLVVNIFLGNGCQRPQSVISINGQQEDLLPPGLGRVFNTNRTQFNTAEAKKYFPDLLPIISRIPRIDTNIVSVIIEDKTHLSVATERYSIPFSKNGTEWNNGAIGFYISDSFGPTNKILHLQQ